MSASYEQRGSASVEALTANELYGAVIRSLLKLGVYGANDRNEADAHRLSGPTEPGNTYTIDDLKADLSGAYGPIPCDKHRRILRQESQRDMLARGATILSIGHTSAQGITTSYTAFRPADLHPENGIVQLLYEPAIPAGHRPEDALILRLPDTSQDIMDPNWRMEPVANPITPITDPGLTAIYLAIQHRLNGAPA